MNIIARLNFPSLLSGSRLLDSLGIGVRWLIFNQDSTCMCASGCIWAEVASGWRWWRRRHGAHRWWEPEQLPVMTECVFGRYVYVDVQVWYDLCVCVCICVGVLLKTKLQREGFAAWIFNDGFYLPMCTFDWLKLHSMMLLVCMHSWRAIPVMIVCVCTSQQRIKNRLVLVWMMGDEFLVCYQSQFWINFLWKVRCLQ